MVSFKLLRHDASTGAAAGTLLLVTIVSTLIDNVSSSCLSNATLEEIFGGGDSLPKPDSCCMQDVCGLTCPVTTSKPGPGYGIAVAIIVAICFCIGAATYFLVRGQSINFFVAGRSLPLWVVAVTLAAQSVDSNALLGNVDLSYRFSFWDGVVLPVGLGLSLILNGLFLAHHINNDEALTLPDVFAKRYGRIVEVLVSLATTCSFIMLLAGNLLRFGVVTSYLWEFSETASIWMAAAIIWLYTVGGGLYSVTYTDVCLAVIGWSGCVVFAYFMIVNEDPSAPVASIGFPGYIYPDTMDDPNGACAAYDGVACDNDVTACCYNIAKWCPGYNDDPTVTCERYDRGAYPIGDLPIYPNTMVDPLALSPFPSSIFWNWCTIFILAVGNLGALDFQARCMSAKSPSVARSGCILAGCFTFLIGVPFAYLGAITRVYYGPDSVHANYEADSCSAALGIAQCALWLPDPQAFIKLLTHDVQPFLGAWCIVGIIAASMSTANGAILAMGTVMSHNVFRQLDAWFPSLVTPDNLLTAARIATLPMTIISASIAAFYRSSSGGGTGYLLIVAFDIVLATVVVPLLGCFYCRQPSPRAALLGIVGGGFTRILLEFVLPKDGFLILPFDYIEFYDVGPAPNALFPFFVDVPADQVWNPSDGACQQEQYKDFTGVDSLVSPLVCLILFVTVQTIEWKTGRAIFEYAGSEAYLKDTTEHPLKSSLHIGNMGIPVEVWEQNHDNTQNTKISFADDSGKPIQTQMGNSHANGMVKEHVTKGDDATPDSAMEKEESA
ncbi:hypothetical protein MPSEU_000671700 [Mayamaea pseudoterrestris]|nr:hypothetical protein MPSEU_000671700 [Mayamaea pseudoterrestris]